MKSTIKISTFIILFFGFYSCESSNKGKDYGNMLIEKVEAFKKSNNRLPKNVSELGLPDEMDSPAYFQMENDSTYIVYYGLTLGESNVYNSITKKWSE